MYIFKQFSFFTKLFRTTGLDLNFRVNFKWIGSCLGEIVWKPKITGALSKLRISPKRPEYHVGILKEAFFNHVEEFLKIVLQSPNALSCLLYRKLKLIISLNRRWNTKQKRLITKPTKDKIKQSSSIDIFKKYLVEPS